VLFWGEFASRFNFIAVDYLIYTQEVIGNIVESYPVGLLLGGVPPLDAETSDSKQDIADEVLRRVSEKLNSANRTLAVQKPKS